MFFSGLAVPLSIAGLTRVATNLGVDLATIFALMDVETAGCGFLPDRRVVCRFEHHIFRRLSGGRTLFPGQERLSSYQRLEAAIRVDEDAALQATSWGLGQIMGFNAGKAGYKNSGVRGMISAFADSEDAQMEAIVRFCRNAGLADELRRRDWTGFAYGYNGPEFHKNDYDTKLAEAYEHYSHPANSPNIRVRAEQVKMMFAGIYQGKIDGIDGPLTVAARDIFASQGSVA